MRSHQVTLVVMQFMAGHMIGLVGAMVLFPFTMKAKARHAAECHSYDQPSEFPSVSRTLEWPLAHVVEYGRTSLCVPSLLTDPFSCPWTFELLPPLDFCKWCVCDISVQIPFTPLLWFSWMFTQKCDHRVIQQPSVFSPVEECSYCFSFLTVFYSPANCARGFNCSAFCQHLLLSRMTIPVD